MAKLPVVSGQRAVKAFTKAGWTPERQHGSHLVLSKPGREEILTVPLHKELKRGMLRALIRDAGLEVDEFVKLL